MVLVMKSSVYNSKDERNDQWIKMNVSVWVKLNVRF